MEVDRSHVTAMAEAARWAPSVLNTQPWRFRSRPDGLSVLVDDSRALPRTDPTGRLRTISCGAAVSNAALASVTAGYGTRVQLLPDGPRGRTVAHVVAVAPRTPTVREQRLARVVRTRRSHRDLCPHELVPGTLLGDVVDTVADEGAMLTALDDGRRHELARLVARAGEEQDHRPDVVAETRAWLRRPAPPHHEQPVDGVLLPSTPVPAPSSRTDAPGRSVTASTVVVLSTRTDTRRDHLVAGMALQRLLLHLTALDLVACWVDHVTDVPDTRERAQALLDRPGQPQAVLRVGRAARDVRVAPRRPLPDLLDRPHPAAVVDLTATHERTPTS